MNYCSPNRICFSSLLSQQSRKQHKKLMLAEVMQLFATNPSEQYTLFYGAQQRNVKQNQTQKFEAKDNPLQQWVSQQKIKREKNQNKSNVLDKKNRVSNKQMRYNRPLSPLRQRKIYENNKQNRIFNNQVRNRGKYYSNAENYREDSNDFKTFRNNTERSPGKIQKNSYNKSQPIQYLESEMKSQNSKWEFSNRQSKEEISNQLYSREQIYQQIPNTNQNQNVLQKTLQKNTNWNQCLKNIFMNSSQENRNDLKMEVIVPHQQSKQAQQKLNCDYFVGMTVKEGQSRESQENQIQAVKSQQSLNVSSPKNVNLKAFAFLDSIQKEIDQRRKKYQFRNNENLFQKTNYKTENNIFSSPMVQTFQFRGNQRDQQQRQQGQNYKLIQKQKQIQKERQKQRQIEQRQRQRQRERQREKQRERERQERQKEKYEYQKKEKAKNYYQTVKDNSPKQLSQRSKIAQSIKYNPQNTQIQTKSVNKDPNKLFDLTNKQPSKILNHEKTLISSQSDEIKIQTEENPRKLKNSSKKLIITLSPKYNKSSSGKDKNKNQPMHNTSKVSQFNVNEDLKEKEKVKIGKKGKQESFQFNLDF